MLEQELARVFDALAEHPELGYVRRYAGIDCRRLQLESNYFVIYRVRPRLRVVEIMRIVHATQFYRDD